MLGLMQKQPLLVSSLLTFAERHHGDSEIVSRRVEGDIHRYTYADLARRTRQLANVFDAWGELAGARIGTLAWNGYRHLELYYAAGGSGRVVHTINPRLPPDQIAWIINHADDQALFFDKTFAPLIQAVRPLCPGVEHWVLLADEVPADIGMPGLLAYEALLADEPPDYAWPELDENTACGLCYTSGTTGAPKAVLYSHRSSVLHAYATCLPDAMGLASRDAALPVVPMFHVNAWGLPYAAPLVGAKLVLPGPGLDGKSLYELIEAEGVTFAAGVPTIWQMLLAHLRGQGVRFSTLERTVVGGAACPPAMIDAFEREYGVRVIHAWGMTEMSPLGTLVSLKNKHLKLPEAEQRRLQTKQGRAIFGVDMKVVGDDGQALPHDGQTAGNLHVRGPWVVENYYRNEGASPLVEGWFPTGDVATIDADGFMQITDRSKDVIKSGGEWISSIAIENIAMAHPDVAMAACVGVPHPKWDERPIVFVARKPGSSLSREALLQFYQGKAAKWQIPDDVIFVEAIPLGATGKMLKMKLREQLKDYRLPSA
ncbi:MAG: 3-methylmercaptopropionyl-CoA ligase [Paracidovorax wautersii]|uniref:3-methylmercaptopropionyl-CoA ligase n=1 Tax=Paracidovorax wautersii TaxID=1177982 RepID=A0A7V8FLL6_9BURK|nr:MAG: 3-methylmercaptopropionyl-CoA ligase [Paracidovorax wautersii]